MKAAAISLVRLYQRIAPIRLHSCCRFEPSCSNYALLAIEKHGLTHGVMKALGRLLRCRPPYGGVDLP